MSFASKTVGHTLAKPKTLTGIMISLTVVLAVLAALPTLWPYTFDFLYPLRVDTDPENMLAENEPVRVFHDRMKKTFSLHDMVVVGIVNESSKQGVFNPDSLHRIYSLTRYAETFSWPDPDKPGDKAGIVRSDLIAPSTVDNVQSEGQGAVKFEWLMNRPPLSAKEAVAIRDKAQNLPFLDGTLLSRDGRALALYLPLSSKDLSHKVYASIKDTLPRIWLWGPLNRSLREMPELQKNQQGLNAIQELGRLAAFYARDRQEFRRIMASFADQLSAGNPQAGWQAVKQTASNWKDKAQSLYLSNQERIKKTESQEGELWSWRLKIDLAHKANKSFRDHVQEKIDSSKQVTSLKFAKLYLASLDNKMLSAEELVESVQDFAGRMENSLSGLPALQGLSKEADLVFSSYQDFPGQDKYHITGLPVAEDTFGVLMFKQMAISAPMAMVVIFLLLLYFFRKLLLIISPLIVAMVSVICTMSLLVITGNTVHIMSSMIPIFIMPIAVLDSVHILSEFFDRYQYYRDRKTTMIQTMDALFQPMLFTSLTTAAGFASLALTPIPPVQVFGLFVAFGVIMAWIWTILFIPAFVMFIPERSFKNFGRISKEQDKQPSGFIDKLLHKLGQLTYMRARLIIIAVAVIMSLSAYGISLIQVNDNPVKWFTGSHPIREADRVLNEHFGGTYMAYLTLTPRQKKDEDLDVYLENMQTRLKQRAQELKADLPEAPEIFSQVADKAGELAGKADSTAMLLQGLESYADEQRRQASFAESFAWQEALSFIDQETQAGQIFKKPEVLQYIADLQAYLKTTEVVGKSNSLADIVKTVHRELLGSKEAFRIPDSSRAVAQCLITYQNSHRPQDLWHFTTQNYDKGCIWVQLTSGDNKDMSKVVKAVENYVQENPPVLELKKDWFGLTYINVKWQEKMVWGMLNAFLGSFLVVLLMMSLLFRSALWGLLCMIPLTVTIALIYGSIGFVGKAYDMPVAVLSSLSLGLAVDYAIHFLARSRQLHERYGSWGSAVGHVFGEPSRAITRNVLVIGIGFLPLLAAPLVPYKTVGALIAAILFVAGAASLLILPALIRVLENWLFPATRAKAITCRCGTCIIAAAAALGVVVLNVHKFLAAGWTELTWFSIGALIALAGFCFLMSKRHRCKVS